MPIKLPIGSHGERSAPRDHDALHAPRTLHKCIRSRTASRKTEAGLQGVADNKPRMAKNNGKTLQNHKNNGNRQYKQVILRPYNALQVCKFTALKCLAILQVYKCILLNPQN